MLDLKFVRENQEAVAQAMKNRHASWDASRFSELDEARRAAITEEDAGLHFLLRLDGAPSDETLRREAEQRGIRLAMLSDYYQCPQDAPQHVLVVNYTGIDLDRLPAALERLAALWKENDHV